MSAMNQREDDYAALHAYLHLAEIEIDEVISGRLPHKRSAGTESQLLVNKTNPEYASISLQKNPDRAWARSATKPPRGFRRENRATTKKSEVSDKRTATTCSGLVPSVKYLDESKIGRLRDTGIVNVQPKAAERARYSFDDVRNGDTLEDLSVGEVKDDSDPLLERLLNKEGKTRVQYVSTVRKVEGNQPRDNSVKYLAPASPKVSRHPADLNKLLVSDRHSLLLGSGLGFLDCTKMGMKDCEDITSTPTSSLSTHECNSTRHHHKHHCRHHLYTESDDVCPLLKLDHREVARPSSLPSHHYHCRQLHARDRSGSEKDVLEKIRQKKRAKLLTMIYQDVKLVRRPISPEQQHYLRPIKLEIAPDTSPPPHLPSHVDDVYPELTNSNLELCEDEVDQDMSASDRSGTDTELRDLFAPTVKTFTRDISSRKSYPNDDNLIISPPPGFNSPSSEEEMWVKVRLVTRSHDDLRYRTDSRARASGADDDQDTSPIQYYAVPLEFEATPESRCRVPRSADDLHLRHHTRLKNNQLNQYAPEQPSKIVDCRADSEQIINAGPNEELDIAAPWIMSFQNRGRDEFLDKGHDLKVGPRRQDLNPRALDPVNPAIAIIQDEDVCPPTLATSQSDVHHCSKILPPPSLDWSTSIIQGNGLSSAVMTSYHSGLTNDSKGTKGPNKSDDFLETPTISWSSTAKRSQTVGSDSETSKQALDFDLDLMLDVQEDNNNNTNSNWFSMCLSSDCKHATPCRSKKTSESCPESDTENQSSDAIQKCTANHLASDIVENSLKRDCNHLQLSIFPNISSCEGGTRINTESRQFDKDSPDIKGTLEVPLCTGNVPVDTPHFGIKDIKLEQDLNRIIHPPEVCCNHKIGKVIMKDTAVQTSLEVDTVTVDNSENVASHSRNVVGVPDYAGNCNGEKNSNVEDNKKVIENCDKNNRKCSLVRDEIINTDNIQHELGHINVGIKASENKGDNLPGNKECKGEQEVVETRKIKSRRPPRTSFLRSKSIHGSELNGEEARGKSGFRPESPGLCGSLRELSHLNIDVSQRLVDGERRFVVHNGSPELQVVVNALTPVLSRRNRSRNARRLQNTSPAREINETTTSLTRRGDLISDLVGQQHNVCVATPSSFRRNLDSGAVEFETETLPLYARLRTPEGSVIKVDSNSPKEILPNYTNGFTGGRSISPANQMFELERKSSGSSIINETNETDFPARGHITGREHGLPIGHDDASEKLQLDKDSGFHNCKLAHTWHGASSSSAHRSAPRMGVGRELADDVKFVCGPDGQIRPVFPRSPSPSSDYQQNSYTMPVISRTLLDALHKRYCAHQYSSNYQTLQPFSLLRLDSTFSSGNQSVTALLVEPRRARDHEVHAAPPSPEVMARLRLLSTAFEADKDKDGVHPVLQPLDPEPPPLPPRNPQPSEESSSSQSAEARHQNHPELQITLPEEKLHVASLTGTPNSSPSLTYKLNHSNKHHGELEAAEALKWLRAAGFPQYAQMFDDGQFPVDMGVVERDHDFLDKDSLQSLFRRLETLNKYAGIRLDSLPCKKATSEEEDEDDFCALSERWEYQKSVRRWSRKDLTPSSQKAAVTERSHRELAARSGSHDSLLADQDSGSQTGDSPLLDSKMPHQTIVQHQGKNEMASLSHGGHAVAEIALESPDQKDSPTSPRFRRAGSERMKTAKNIFKKMDGLKSTKSRRHANHRNIVEISGPVLADRENMQLKLDRLNCVDISQPGVSLPSPQLTHPMESDHTNRSSSSGPNGQPNSPELYSPKSLPQSPTVSTSPRPHSDFMLRPKEINYPSDFTSSSQARSSHTSPTPNSSSNHDSSFDEYYHAKTTFLQNLQSSQGRTTEGVRKNNSDTNLVEIFLVPQDHQPGRFPRMLQNGYIETEACGTAVNARTGSVRLGRGTGLTSDHKSPTSRLGQPPSVRGFGQRISVYDNFLPSDGRKLEENETQSIIPGVIELGSPADRSATAGHTKGDSEINQAGLGKEINSDPDNRNIMDTSRDRSSSRTSETVSDQEYRNSVHETSVSFESSSSSSQTLKESSLANEGVLSNSDSQSSRKSSPDSLSSKSRGVIHSSSVDSYFPGSSSLSEAQSSDNSGNVSSSTFQQDYDEFDRILQELYQNINDLTSFMDRDKNEKAPKLIRAATSPLPAGSKELHSHLHVATPSSARPLLKPQPAFDNSSPSSATSDLVHSPASPRSPDDGSEPMNFYRVLDLDNENSSSGGEGNTAESGSEDQEAALTDLSHDDSLDQIIEVSRERRDSGVGHSLTRASSDRRHKKIRWHSFQKSHRPDITSRAMQINSLTVGQLVRLQKLSLLKLTGIMEKCLPVNKSGWNWMVPRFMKRHKAPDFSDRNVFGVPLSVMAQRTGQPLPQCVLYAMRYLRRTCQSAVGIFRKSGVKSKIQQLRDYLEAHPDTTNFDGENTYNVADMVKTYFRDLPECLLTNKMSETFRSIYTYVPQSQRLEAIQAAILLLPDENREVLQSILLFLSDISVHEADHQMNASNLSVCFTPTVFHLGPRQSVPYSPKRNRKNSSGVPDPREILEQKAAHECLLMMITECKKLFTVPHNQFRQLQVQSLAHMEPTLPQDIGNSPADIRAFGQERIQMVLKESHDKNRGWIPTMTIGDVEVFHRKPMDDCPLKEWKLMVDIEAPPIEVLRRIMHERHTWDEDLLSWSVVERLDPYSDIFQFVLNTMAPHPPRNFCVLRYWRSDLNKGACSLISMSVEHSDALEIHGVWAIDLGTYFLMEPCGSGRSRLTYITRVDTRGRMPEWYTKIFGHISANFLERLKESFKQDASGPETKV